MWFPIGRVHRRWALVFILSPSLCHAGPVPERFRAPRAVLDTVRVTAPRPGEAERLLRAPGFSSSISTRQISTPGGVAEAVGRAPGLHVTSSGGPGAFATLSIRGSSAQQVSYYLDGVPLRWSEFGALNLNDLPYESLQRIEVHRSHLPMELGSGGPGGAVNLISDTANGLAGRFHVASGSYGERWESAGGSLRAGGWSAHASLTHTAYRGDFDFRDDHGTGLNSSDDSLATRRNNSLERWRGSILLSRGALGAGLYGFTADQGLPGLGYSQALRTRYSASGQAAHLFWRATGDGEGPRLAAETFYTRGATYFQDPRGEMRVGFLESRSVDESAGLRFTLARQLAAGIHLGALLQQSVERWAPEFLIPRRTARGANRSSGLLRMELERETGPARVSAGARAEWWSDHGSSIDRLGHPTAPLPGRVESRILPHGAGSIRLAPGLWIKGGGGAYLRLPSMSERFGIEGSQVGSATLRPEQGADADLGATFRTGGADRFLEAEAARFWARSTDLIVLEPNSSRTAIPQNVGRAVTSGEEFHLRGRAGLARVDASATWLRAVDDTDNPYLRGKQLPNRPEREVRAELALDLGVVSPALRVAHLGSHWLDRAHSPGSLLASRTLWALDLDAPLERAGLVLHLTFDNLTDRRVSDVDGYPLPGRSVLVGLTWVAPGRDRERNGKEQP